MYTNFVKNITISVEDDLYRRIREAANSDSISMNVYIREALRRTVRSSSDSTGARLAALAEQIGPTPASWRWNRAEIYEDAL